MKLCYVDESGNNDRDPCLVMVGIVVDSTRLNRTRQEFNQIFDVIQDLFQDNLQELKGTKIIFGRDRWRNIDPEKRKRIVEFFCKWVAERKHQIAVSAIDRNHFTKSAKLCSDPWLAAGLHIALQIQKFHQGKSKNKGHTILIMDENKQKADEFAELLFDPPEWTDDYYGRRKNQERLDQLIDTAFTVKSHHAGLVQVADIFALIMRRYAEFHDYDAAEQWKGEKSFIEKHIEALAHRMLPKAMRWPEKIKANSCKWYNDIAPPSLRRLGR